MYLVSYYYYFKLDGFLHLAPSSYCLGIQQNFFFCLEGSFLFSRLNGIACVRSRLEGGKSKDSAHTLGSLIAFGAYAITRIIM